MPDPHDRLNRRITDCQRCPRLRRYCAKVARNPRAAFRGQDYWGRPVPNFLPREDPAEARILLVGLAPAAHGANRTGRMFTGDRSGDFLFAAMHDAGLANQAEATAPEDGLSLRDTVITAAAHCAPPDNKPTPGELANCSVHLRDTFDAMPRLRVVVTLGKIAHDAVLRLYRDRGWIERLKDATFGHGAEHRVGDGAPVILCTYHPSQQNTFTGRLTPAMLRKVLDRAKVVARES